MAGMALSPLRCGTGRLHPKKSDVEILADGAHGCKFDGTRVQFLAKMCKPPYKWHRIRDLGSAIPRRVMEERFEAAKVIARQAGALARDRYAQLTAPIPDPAGADRPSDDVSQAVELFAIEKIRALFPRDSAYGEEFGGVLGDPLWVIDPIDGAVNFGRRLPYYCISIAVVSAGVTEIGVVYDPTSDELFAARRGAGADVNGRALRCSGCSDPGQACIGLGYSTRTRKPKYLATLGRLIDAGFDYRRLSAAALMLAHVADGRFDGFYESHLHSWDALAGILLCEEAGALVNDFSPVEQLRSGGPTLACTPGLWPILHDMLLEAEYA